MGVAFNEVLKLRINGLTMQCNKNFSVEFALVPF
jgi:hypothetical protein